MFQNNERTCTVPLETLIDVWQVLENLTVSIDRIGSYQLLHGDAAAKEALQDYVNPTLCNLIVNARHELVIMMEKCDPRILHSLEEIAETQIQYWDGPSEVH